MEHRSFDHLTEVRYRTNSPLINDHTNSKSSPRNLLLRLREINVYLIGVSG